MPGSCDIGHLPLVTGDACAVSRCGGRALTFYRESHPLAPDIFDVSDTHAIRTVGTVILMISYGYPVKEHDDPIVDIVEAAVKGFSESMEPGTYLVDMIPSRKPLSLPDALLWIPTTSSLLSTSSTIRA